MGDTLVAVDAAFLAAGLLARAGRRIGLPTIPFFMAAGVIFGPNTAGIALVEDPHDLELLAALGLILLLFHLGLEFSLNDLLAGGRKLLWIGAIYLLLNVGGGFLLGLVMDGAPTRRWSSPERSASPRPPSSRSCSRNCTASRILRAGSSSGSSSSRTSSSRCTLRCSNPPSALSDAQTVGNVETGHPEGRRRYRSRVTDGPLTIAAVARLVPTALATGSP